MKCALTNHRVNVQSDQGDPNFVAHLLSTCGVMLLFLVLCWYSVFESSLPVVQVSHGDQVTQVSHEYPVT